jgi:thiosulfate/3-mercaptopyruvate sulfurtransferase
MNPLITANQLEKILNAGVDILICDCRFDLTQPSAGRESYATGQLR